MAAEYNRSYDNIEEFMADMLPRFSRYHATERALMLRVGLNKMVSMSSIDALSYTSKLQLRMLADRHPAFQQDPARFLLLLESRLEHGERAVGLPFPVRYGARSRRHEQLPPASISKATAPARVH